MSSPRIVFLIGAPRSGTTWLQSLLGSHPSVVTPQETDLFSTFIAPLQKWWDHQLERSSDEHVARRRKGLPAVLDDTEFAELLATIVASVLDAVRALKADAKVIVEKSPSHSHHVDLIAKYVPEATFLHMVRDGRDVVSSLQSASSGWGNYWAPSDLKAATLMWKANVLAALDAGRTHRCTEIRYEQLRAGDPKPLQEAFTACGISMTEDECASLLDEFSLDRMAKGDAVSPIAVGGDLGGLGTHREPQGFFGKGSVGGWANSWSDRDRLLFDALAGDLLVELGYEPDHSWAGSARQRAWYLRRSSILRLIGRGGRGIGRRIARRAERLLRTIPDL